MLKAEGGMWMHIKEAARQTEMSVRAIKHYEEKGLLQPEKDESGYRVFREQDLERLRQISVYRKLGMEITVIREVLNDPKKERAALERLYEQKQSERALCEQQLCAIRICWHRQGIMERWTRSWSTRASVKVCGKCSRARWANCCRHILHRICRWRRSMRNSRRHMHRSSLSGIIVSCIFRSGCAVTFMWWHACGATRSNGWHRRLILL